LVAVVSIVSMMDLMVGQVVAQAQVVPGELLSSQRV
jgi:hypothetical protein